MTFSLHLDKHDGGVTVLRGPAVDTHGLAVARELEREILLVLVLGLPETGTGTLLVSQGGSVLSNDVDLLCQYLQGHLCCLSNLLIVLTILYTCRQTHVPTARESTV